MPVNLDNVVPWGRSLDEYVRMFDLAERDLESRILDCGGGPASFNVEMHRRGRSATSCDPIYRFSAAEISRRIDETHDTILQKTAETRDRFLWHEMKSPEHVGQIRMAAMTQFLDDLPLGLAEGRYRVAGLPALPFRDGEFDLALCSHFLFTYSHLFSLDFHLASVRELCRIAGEARIFPLLPNFGDAHSPHVAPLVSQLSAERYRCEIRRVPYEFQKGGNEMLRVSHLKS
jgi:hypothetical protein